MVADTGLLSGLLDAAARAGVSLSPLARRYGLDLPGAYAVQAALVERRLARGERVVGLKMGFTSEAMRRQMGVDRPNCGWLTDAMAAETGGGLALGALIHPRVEPEVAVRLGRDIACPSEDQAVIDAVEACAPALEVVDSRFHDYRFQLEDNVADNSSAAAFVVGAWRPWPQDLGGLSVRLSLDGRTVEEGSTDPVLGHPLESLKQAARLACELGRPLKAGMIVLTGGVTSAHAIRPGEQVRASFEQLGDVGFLAG